MDSLSLSLHSLGVFSFMSTCSYRQYQRVTCRSNFNSQCQISPNISLMHPLHRGVCFSCQVPNDSNGQFSLASRRLPLSGRLSTLTNEPSSAFLQHSLKPLWNHNCRQKNNLLQSCDLFLQKSWRTHRMFGEGGILRLQTVKTYAQQTVLSTATPSLPQAPIEICETRTLNATTNFTEALSVLRNAIGEFEQDPPSSGSGVVRLQVPLPPEVDALQWLRAQPFENKHLRIYFSERASRGSIVEGLKGGHMIDGSGIKAVAGLGSSVIFHGTEPFHINDWCSIRRYLCESSPFIRIYGGLRFNPNSIPSKEWQPFGAFYFALPLVEVCECDDCSLLACTLVWDNSTNREITQATKEAMKLLGEVVPYKARDRGKAAVEVERREHVPAELAWHVAVAQTLDSIRKAKGAQETNDTDLPGVKPWLWDRPLIDKLPLTKVVMARQTILETKDPVDSLGLLSSLQERDPRAYQFCLQLPCGSSFIGSTPERLFVRKGLRVASEAVAATRPRGNTGTADYLGALDLIFSEKDHNEFEIVRESVHRHMAAICHVVEVEEDKQILQQARVQHLYSRLNGVLHSESGEYDMLARLHPTPAVCGHPQSLAQKVITDGESFDRGMYAGPIGWFGGDGCEFSVGIRSALIPNTNSIDNSEDPTLEELDKAIVEREPHKFGRVILYAGVGVVQGTTAASEWEELNLKTSQFDVLLGSSQSLETAVNINALWAQLAVEECCRLGSTYFCIAPGSRSSPLAIAAANNPRAQVLMCYDERSLAFNALGYGRATNRPAIIITSSGTAVVNLMPAVVEGSQDCVPMLILTADRPPELRDTGANQTINQVNIFGAYTRYHVDLPPPDDFLPARMLLTTIDSGINRATSSPSGPVHINCPFREPLAFSSKSWNKTCLKGLSQWAAQSSPYTTYTPVGTPRFQMSNTPSNRIIFFGSELQGIVDLIRGAKRGLIVMGGLRQVAETWAAAELAKHLGWPVYADVLSGLRVLPRGSFQELSLVPFLDHVLLSSSANKLAAPDLVLQLGSRLTGKRIASLLEQSALNAHILVEEHPFRHDSAHCLTHRLQIPLPEFSHAIISSLSEDFIKEAPSSQKEYTATLMLLSKVVGRALSSEFEKKTHLSEPWVARTVTKNLLPGEGLFLGNSMAIRDTDMYAVSGTEDLPRTGQKLKSGAKQSVTESLQNDEGASFFYEGLRYSPRVDANRGASGIDGVLSTAVGFAAGIKRPATLLIGDLSFLHDTNGLSLLSPRPGQPPLTVVVVNNKGGGIFSLLPVAETLPESTFTMLFSTPQDVSLESLCRAHRVNYSRVGSRSELEEALSVAKRAQVHWVIEVPGVINENTRVHRELQEVARKAADQILSLSESFSGSLQNFSIVSTVSEVHLRRYRLPLLASPSVSSRQKQNKSTNVEITKPREREGIIIRLVLANGVEGFGEVAPLPGLHNETLEESEEQLRMFAYDLRGISLSLDLAMLSGAFDSWFFRELGYKPEEIYPSVRCGIEMAILNALANSSHSTNKKSVLSGKQTGYLSLSDLLCTEIPPDSLRSPSSSSISTTPPLSTSKISNNLTALEFTSKLNETLEGQNSDSSCDVDESNPEEDDNMFVFSAALIDSEGSPSDVASEALDLINQGFKTLKLKVARRASPAEDARTVLAVRAAVGPKVNLRVDANRRWNLMEAKAFAQQAEKANLQFIEEPVNNPKALKAFYASTGLPFALDESLDDGLIGPGVAFPLDVGRDSGLAAVVIKPSVVGGFERSSSIIRWAFSEGIGVIISSAFESSIALAAYTELAHFSDFCFNQERKALSNKKEGKQSNGSVVGERERRNLEGPYKKTSIFYHGLGTFAWLAVDTVQESQSFRRGNVLGRKGDKENGQLGILLESTRTLLKDPVFEIGSEIRVDEKLSPEIEKVEVGNYIYNLCVYDTESLKSKTDFSNDTFSRIFEPLKDYSQNYNDKDMDVLGTGENINLFNDTKELQNLSDCPTLIFLHGFLGSSEDWFPIIRSLEVSFRCIAIDIPGQGLSRVVKGEERNERNGEDKIRQNFKTGNQENDGIRRELQMEAIGEVLMQTITRKIKGKIIVIGYSMGARVALYLSMKFTEKVAGAVIVSGSPGIRAADKRLARAAQDDALAKSLRMGGLEKFVDSWYKRPLWKSLRSHPMFSAIKARRIENWNLSDSEKTKFPSAAEEAADILSALSTGRQPSLWDNISSCPTRLLLVVGSLDKKFLLIAQEMRAEWQSKEETKGTSVPVTEDWQEMVDFNPSFNPWLRSSEAEQTSWETFFEREMNRMQLEDALEAEPGIHSDIAESEVEALEDEKAQFDHVDVVEVEGVGHAVHVEAKGKLLKEIREFALQYINKS